MTRKELLEKAKPILFNTDMVQAILEDRKTVTRRCVKFPANRFVDGVPNPKQLSVMEIKSDKVNFHQEPFFCISVKPPFKKGDYLYVRETWHVCKGKYIYKAGFNKGLDDLPLVKWRPSIHMPKEAARIFLKVTDVRVERLQDIMKDAPGPNNQVVREGCTYGCDFIAVWESTVKNSEKDAYGWDANPWVWVIEFEKIQQEMFV